MIKHFGASPGLLPQEVMAEISAGLAIKNGWTDGFSVLEMSFRDEHFVEFLAQIHQDLRKLLSIPEDYAILFLPCSARALNGIIPLNLLNESLEADYLVTGYWSQLSYNEAKRYGNVHLHDFYGKLPEQLDQHECSTYLHYCDNETADGLEYSGSSLPPTSLPLIADMSSNLATKPIDWSRFGGIYANTQKMFGSPGLSMIIIRSSMLSEPKNKLCPQVFNFQELEKSFSLMTTMPVFSFYIFGILTKWLLKQGSLEDINQRYIKRVQPIYDLLDQSNLYKTNIQKSYRSRINICFQFDSKDKEQLFLAEAAQNNFYGIKGHANVGGVRLSLYHGVTEQLVDQLIDFMKNFEKKNG